MGRTEPPVADGTAAPTYPLSRIVEIPAVTIAGVAVEVLFSGLVPGQVGVYQVNVNVYGDVPEGNALPLQVTAAGASTAVPVRVVD